MLLPREQLEISHERGKGREEYVDICISVPSLLPSECDTCLNRIFLLCFIWSSPINFSGHQLLHSIDDSSSDPQWEHPPWWPQKLGICLSLFLGSPGGPNISGILTLASPTFSPRSLSPSLHSGLASFPIFESKEEEEWNTQRAELKGAE